MTNDLIFGYTWEQIKNAQQGGTLARALHQVCPLHAGAAENDICRDGDIERYKELGADGLHEQKLYGIIDRLTRAGIMKETA